MNYVNQIKSVALGLILAFGISLAGATWTAPTASPTDNGAVSAPIDTSASDQAKAGTLSIASTAAATSPYKLDVLGYILSTGLAVAGGADIQGNIKSDTLASTGSQKVCADSAGVLTLCAGDTLSVVYTGSGTLVIPTNATAMTVEMWGGGGGSYSRITSSSDGGDSTFSWSGGGGTITAGGGKKATSSAGGSGGTYTTPIYSKYNYITQTNGGSGGSRTTATGHGPAGGFCGTMYNGDTGGSGGSGGSSNGISGPSGGTGGAPGTTSGISCGSNVVNSGSYGTSGVTPSDYGVGGSGIGGTGGSSGDTYPGDPLLIGENGYSGGGGAAYVKFTVNITAQETYNFSAGQPGQAFNTWPYGGFAPGNWPLAGQGATGAIKITYTL